MRLLFLVFVFISSLFAHKLNLFYLNENDKIYFNSYFASGSPCQECSVEIYDNNNKLIKKLKTDKKGEFVIENMNNFFVKVHTIEGHAVEQKVVIDKKITNKKAKELTENKYVEAKKQSLMGSFIAILAILFIFYLLKRFKKDDKS
ncbi:MAG: hypothetical protein ACNI25_01250 [Halarcobacter sp.]